MVEARKVEVPPEFTILTKVEIPSFQPGRTGRRDVMVTYQTDPAHVFTTTMAAEDFTEDRMVEHISKLVREDFKIIGQTYKVK
jgi:hypothetical protein